MRQPNVIFVFADQWRAQAVGYAGDPNVLTPHLNALAAESINFTSAISGCPVCSPWRASFLSGQYPLTHGVFMNDVFFQPQGPTIAEAYAASGYETAYVGKWHLDGHGRSAFIPRERRRGFSYWKVLECTHDYHHSAYYEDDCEVKKYWNGYDAIAQTRDVQEYIRARSRTGSPFFLVLSWGPPHDPYHTAPKECNAKYEPSRIVLRPNVPEDVAQTSREHLAGYYAHCAALDSCVGDLLRTIRECGIEDNTLFVFTSDHGDMLGSHGEEKKQRPWEESIRVPFLLRWPGMPGWRPRAVDALIDTPDIMPTLLGLCGIPVPAAVEGHDLSGHIRGGPDPTDGAVLLICVQPFGEWSRQCGGREYRGVRTKRYTYVRDRCGPWLCYDNLSDPWQMRNCVDDPSLRDTVRRLDRLLEKKLAQRKDDFLDGMEYVRRFGYTVDGTGTVPYTP